MDAQLQSPTPTHGLGRIHPQTAVGHGRVTLLLSAFKNGGITPDIAIAEAKAAFSVTYHAGADNDWTRVDSMLERIDSLRMSFTDNADIALLETKVAAIVALKANDKLRIESMLSRINSIHAKFVDIELGATADGQKVIKLSHLIAHIKVMFEPQ